MATQRLRTVKTSAGDYTTLAAAIVGEADDLVADDVYLTIECYPMSDTAQVDVDGFTTDATRYIEINSPVGNRHAGTWNTSVYRLECTDGADNLRIQDSFVRINSLQIRR